MDPQQTRSTVIEFPDPLEVVARRSFDAPLELVFDAFWKEEHLRQTIAPFGEQVTDCTVDLRVGGAYHFAFVTDDGTRCSFRGSFLDVQPPNRTVQTWHFEGWPDVHAVETIELDRADDGTSLTWRLRFRDQAGRDHMTAYDGIEANLDNVAEHLATLLGPGAK